MSVIKLRYEGGQAAAYFDFLTKSFVAVGPNNLSEIQSHPAYIRQSFQSQSGLSGEVVFANSGLIAPAATYRPQHGEFRVSDQYPIVPVDRNELATGYPIIFGLEMSGEVLAVTTSDCHLPIIEGIELDSDAIQVRSQDVIYRNNMGGDGSVSIRVLHHGSLTNHKFFAAFLYACRWLRESGYTYKLQPEDHRHPTGLSVFKDHSGAWFVINKYGIFENISKHDPVLEWANSDGRPNWSPTDCQPFDLLGGRWALLDSTGVQYFDESGALLNQKSLTMGERMKFLQKPDTFLQF